MTRWQTYYHLTWTTKNREPLLIGEAVNMVLSSIHQVGIDKDVFIHAVGIMPDHIHLAASIPPKLADAEVVRLIKGKSSYLVNQNQPIESGETFAWQAEYGVFTFGERSLNDVVGYLRNQATHHAEKTTIPYFEQLGERSHPRR